MRSIPPLAQPEEEQPVVFDDDDAVIMPAPDAGVFAPRARKTRRSDGGRHAAVYQTVEFRRTIIPVLLTCGLLTIAFGSLKFALGPDSPLADLPGWLPIALFITGTLLLALGVLNMLSVRQQLMDAGK